MENQTVTVQNLVEVHEALVTLLGKPYVAREDIPSILEPYIPPNAEGFTMAQYRAWFQEFFSKKAKVS
jgi:hypothetical protein